ncbi:MAG: MMPL family transporter [Bacteroidetes bacterium]|nr:MMPL family transporter [Bacteroidota bacterium]
MRVNRKYHKIISRLLIAAITIATIWAASVAKEIEFNYDIEAFFSNSDPSLEYYHDFRATFENDNDFVLVGVTSEDGVLNHQFLSKIDSVTKRLERLELIQYIHSPTNLKRLIVAPLGNVVEAPVLHIDNPERYDTDAKRIFNSPGYWEAFFSSDTSAVSIYIKKEEFTQRANDNKLLGEIKSVLNEFDFDEYHLAGRINTQQFYISQMNAEMSWFLIVALSMLLAFLIVTFRTLLGVVIPLVVLIIAVIWTVAIIKLSGERFGLMMTMLPTLLFVIGISNSVHLLNKYFEELKRGKSKEDAIALMIKEVGFATFLASSTTAIGFLSLLVIDIAPIQKFGVYTATGVMITYVTSLLLMPSILLNVEVKKFSWSTRFGNWWTRFLGGLFETVLRSYKAIGFVALLLTLISIWGIQKIVVNNHFLDDLNDGSPLKADMEFFEKHFSGIRPFEMGIELEDSTSSILDLEVLEEIDKIDNYLKAEYGVGSLLSPAWIVKEANSAMNGGLDAKRKLPENKSTNTKVIRALKKYRILPKSQNILGKDLLRGRIAGYMNDLGRIQIYHLNKKLQKFIEANTEKATFHLTGAAELMDNANSKIAVNLMKGLGFAFLIIALIIGIIFRSVKISLLSLLPNIIPLIIIAGVMGFAGIELKVATALIFTIAFGIAVDDTIHMLSRLRMERKKGREFLFALKSAVLTSGKAIILTSFILSAGFLTFLVSDFQSTFHIGLLISITLFVALLADLFLLPALLVWLHSNSAQDSI